MLLHIIWRRNYLQNIKLPTKESRKIYYLDKRGSIQAIQGIIPVKNIRSFNQTYLSGLIMENKAPHYQDMAKDSLLSSLEMK